MMLIQISSLFNTIIISFSSEHYEYERKLSVWVECSEQCVMLALACVVSILTPLTQSLSCSRAWLSVIICVTQISQIFYSSSSVGLINQSHHSQHQATDQCRFCKLRSQ